MGSVASRMSVMMFLQFFIWGAWYVTVGKYMGSLGMFSHIGTAYTVGPIAAVISPFFLGVVADRFFATERVLGVLHILGGISMLCAPLAAQAGPDAFIVVLFIHMLFYMPTLGLTNTLAFHNLDNQEKQFPLIRVFGTIGWIVAGILVSFVLKADTDNLQFYITGLGCFVLGVYSFGLPHTPPQGKGKDFSLREIAGLDALALLKQPSFAVFIACSFLICIPLAGYYAYAPTFAGKIFHDTNVLKDTGFTMSFGQMSEIIFMLAMPLFFARLGVKWMLAVGMAAWVIRYGLFSAANDMNIGWMVLIGIILHGICYDFFFVTGYIYTDKKCKPEIRGQAQGLLVMVTLGFGLGLGSKALEWIIGKGYTPVEAANLNNKAGELVSEAFAMTDKMAAAKLTDQARQMSIEANKLMDWQGIWLLPCVFAAVVLVIFVLFFKDDSNKKLS